MTMDANGQPRPLSPDPNVKQAHARFTPTTSQDPPQKQESNDLAESIPGLYRVLDLINEQGSGGLGEVQELDG